jgi:FKBP-type peptidyl-prolyl cis-trans isomerase
MTALPLALALAATLAVACGSNGSKTAVASGSGTTATTGPTATAAGPTSAAGVSATKPVVDVPSGPAPTTLQIKDLVVGTGPAAAAGQNVTVQYVGVDYATKKQFDASWDRGQPFPFALGQGQVIQGWDQGVVGMKVGGRRELIIPPGLAYGAQGSPPAIGPNATLVFVVDLVSIG